MILRPTSERWCIRGDKRGRSKQRGLAVYCEDRRKLEEFRKKAADQLSIDGGGHLS